MLCQEFEIRLQEILDRREAPERDSSLHAHADSCRHCSGILRAQRQLFQAFPPHSKTLSTSARNRPHPRHRLASQRSFSAWTTAVIAAVLLLAVGALPWVRQGINGPVSLDRARSAVVVRTPDWPGQQMALSDASFAAWQNVQQALRRDPSSAADPSQESISSGLQPLTNSLQETFGGLRHLIPTPPEDSKEPTRPGMSNFQLPRNFA